MLVSKNPYTGEEISRFEEFSDAQIEKALSNAQHRFQSWKNTSFKDRAALLENLAKELKDHATEYAKDVSLEMGKPISQAITEIEKCAWVCEYYAQQAEGHLASKTIKTEADSSYVVFEPLGVILAVMPWNYPFWQVFRFAAPALMAGNIAVLKHASNVMRSAGNIEKAFKKSGYPEGAFQNLVISSKKVEKVIRDPRIKAVTLTGSTPAGSAVASVAGEEIKKSVLELGGSNALVVFEDANLQESIKTCVQARFQNTGQSCIAGKRLLLHKNIANDFLEKFIRQVKGLKGGDPLNHDTYIGVLAREDLAEDLDKQVQQSIKQGAALITGGLREKAFYEPTILDRVVPGMPVFDQETFGPAIGVTIFNDENEAVELVNASDFGLGVSVFTEDFDFAKKLVPRFDEGSVFINELVKSDPRLPFGGIKISGYGRELSEDGIKEFVNRKTIFFNKF